MPAIGEIKYGRDIGYKSSMKFVWSACDTCGKQRWVMMVRGKAETSKCNSCSKLGKKLSHSDKVKFPPQIGIVVKGIDIGYKDKKTKYVGEICPNCGLPRWVQLKDAGRYPKCRKCLNKGRIAERSSCWSGGKTHSCSGYIYVRIYPDNPFYLMAESRGYVMEHRLVMAKSLGRCLEDIELVHHLNGIKTDNRIENLKLFASAQEHLPSVKVQKRIKELEARVTLIEAENTLLKMDMSEFV